MAKKSSKQILNQAEAIGEAFGRLSLQVLDFDDDEVSASVRLYREVLPAMQDAIKARGGKSAVERFTAGYSIGMGPSPIDPTMFGSLEEIWRAAVKEFAPQPTNRNQG